MPQCRRTRKAPHGEGVGYALTTRKNRGAGGQIKRAHTLDLSCVLAAEWGPRPRTGQAIQLHLGALDSPATGQDGNVGKTFKGFD